MSWGLVKAGPRRPTACRKAGPFLDRSDGRQWEEIDRREHPEAWKPDESRIYAPSRPGQYQYVRIRIDAGFDPAVVRIPNLGIVGWDDAEEPLEKVTIRDRPFWDKAGPFWEKVGPFPMGLQFDFPTPTTALGYLMLAGPWGADSTGRMPAAWELFGSDDGRSWTSIDVHSGEGGWKNMEERAFRISNPKEYAHYRFVFYATSSYVIWIENIQLLGQLKTFTDAGSSAQH